jgi:hypothetical protein
MGLIERILEPWRRPTMLARPEAAADLMDLPLRREAAAAAIQARQEAVLIGSGLMMDPDDHQYRRLTGRGNQALRRDLTPVQQDRMLEIAWFLWEQNPFAKRLITFMTDLILGEGWAVEAADPRIQQVIDDTWNHRVNQLKTRTRELHNALALNGELILPVEVNPITGRPILGFLDPIQVKDVVPNPQNILQQEFVQLRSDRGSLVEGDRLAIVREDPATGKLAGQAFYFAINRLPNSMRGRSDLLPLADWLDLYDQYLFAEVERLHLLSSFVWDYKIEDADDKLIQEKLKKLPNPKPGAVFGHNQKETLDARTPDLKSSDRSEAGRMLRIHIAGSYGMPLSWLGETDSNRATIEGQADVMMKTPAARQKEFGGFLDLIVRFSIEQALAKNPALFRDADLSYRIRMPEVQTKDVARVGQILAQVVGAMDAGMNNKTVSRQLAVTVTVAMLKHLGVDVDTQEVIAQADQDAEGRDDMDDLIAAGVARARALTRQNPQAGDDEDLDAEGGA